MYSLYKVSLSACMNDAGAGALSIWLLAVPMEIPPRGYGVLWVIAISVLLVGMAELIHRKSRRRKP